MMFNKYVKTSPFEGVKWVADRVKPSVLSVKIILLLKQDLLSHNFIVNLKQCRCTVIFTTDWYYSKNSSFLQKFQSNLTVYGVQN